MAGHARGAEKSKMEHEEEHEPRGGNAVLAQLTRIADALERAYPLPKAPEPEPTP